MSVSYRFSSPPINYVATFARGHPSENATISENWLYIIVFDIGLRSDIPFLKVGLIRVEPLLFLCVFLFFI